MQHLRRAVVSQVKLEYLNPFGSGKDRAVKQFLTQADGIIGQEVVEASSGSTAISLVQLGHILKRKVTLFLPNDLA
jgi:cysteine synthase